MSEDCVLFELAARYERDFAGRAKVSVRAFASGTSATSHDVFYKSRFEVKTDVPSLLNNFRSRPSIGDIYSSTVGASLARKANDNDNSATPKIGAALFTRRLLILTGTPASHIVELRLLFVA
jgi:hypothetical protein